MWWRERTVTLQALAHLEQLAESHRQLLTERAEQIAYWRTRYERLADAVLLRAQEIHAPVHVERDPLTKDAESGDSLVAKVFKAFDLVGRDAPPEKAGKTFGLEAAKAGPVETPAPRKLDVKVVPKNLTDPVPAA